MRIGKVERMTQTDRERQEEESIVLSAHENGDL